MQSLATLNPVQYPGPGGTILEDRSPYFVPGMVDFTAPDGRLYVDKRTFSNVCGKTNLKVGPRSIPGTRLTYKRAPAALKFRGDPGATKLVFTMNLFLVSRP